MQTRKEIPWLHYLRVYACLLVVANHATHIPLDENIGQTLHDWTLCVTRPCNSLFFMISGALLLPYKCDDFILFYKKRLSRIIPPLIFWCIVYAVLPIFVYNESIKTAIDDIVWIPLTYPERIGGILWYLYIYIGILLFLPFLSSKIYCDKRMLNAFLGVWFFVSIMYIVKDYRPYLLGSNRWIHGFDMFVNFSGYIGYMLLGYRLNITHSKGKSGCWVLFSLLMISVIYLLQLKINRFPNGGYRYLLPTTIVLSTFLFLAFRSIPFRSTGRLYSLIKTISKLSFGIYLSHMVFFKTIVQPLVYQTSTSWFHQVYAIALTFVLSLFFSFLVSKIPYNKYIIG